METRDADLRSLDELFDIDLTEDVGRMVFGFSTRFKSSKGGGASVLVLQGGINPDHVFDRLKSKDSDVVVTEHSEFVIYEFDGDRMLVFPAPGVAVLAEGSAAFRQQFKAVLADNSKSVIADGNMARLIQSVDTDDSLWAISDSQELLSDAGLEQMTLSFGVGGGLTASGILHFADVEDAKRANGQLASMLYQAKQHPASSGLKLTPLIENLEYEMKGLRMTLHSHMSAQQYSDMMDATIKLMREQAKASE
jgi:hypothetical protein